MQAKKRAEFFLEKSVSAVFTSPMERTLETATIIGNALGLKPEMDDRLLEVRSPLQGMTKAAIEAIQIWDWSMYESSWYKERHGENIQEISMRIQAVCEEKKIEFDGKTVVLVTHGDLVMLGAAVYSGMPLTPNVLNSLSYVPMAGGYGIEFREGNEATVYPIVAS